MTEVPVVTVRGEAFSNVDPEIATLTVTISTRDRDREATLRRLTGLIEQVRDILGGFHAAIEKQETYGLHTYPEGKRAGEKASGYAGGATTTVTVSDFDALGELRWMLANRDQVQVTEPCWALRPDSPAYRQGRRDAVADAISRATQYAESVGARVTHLIELADPGSYLNRTDDRGLPFPPVNSLQSAYTNSGPSPAPLRLQMHCAVEARFRISMPTALLDPASASRPA
jgi:uncharacterized protein